jgi:hypothetical protein
MSESEPTPEPERELLAVTPLLECGPEGVRLLGPCVVFRARERLVGFASGSHFTGSGSRRIATRLDGRDSIEVGEVEMTRCSGLVAFSLRRDDWASSDVVPLDSSRIGALDHAGRGLPFLVGVAPVDFGFRRVPLRVEIEAVEAADWGGGEEGSEYRARFREPVLAEAKYDGAPLFARHPASRVLGRPAETLVYGFARASSQEGHSAAEDRRPVAELVPMPVGYVL